MNMKNTQETISENLLDNLFARARQDKVEFCDDNFTKVVLNGLPVKINRVRNRKNYPDFIGIFVGLVVAYLVIEPAQLTDKFISILPSNIPISFMSMMIVSMAFSGLALAAWWSVENKPQDY